MNSYWGLVHKYTKKIDERALQLLQSLGIKETDGSLADILYERLQSKFKPRPNAPLRARRRQFQKTLGALDKYIEPLAEQINVSTTSSASYYEQYSFHSIGAVFGFQYPYHDPEYVVRSDMASETLNILRLRSVFLVCDEDGVNAREESEAAYTYGITTHAIRRWLERAERYAFDLSDLDEEVKQFMSWFTPLVSLANRSKASSRAFLVPTERGAFLGRLRSLTPDMTVDASARRPSVLAHTWVPTEVLYGDYRQARTELWEYWTNHQAAIAHANVIGAFPNLIYVDVVGNQHALDYVRAYERITESLVLENNSGDDLLNRLLGDDNESV